METREPERGVSDLVDLASVLWRRKRIAGLTFSAFLLLGLVAIFIFPEHYRFTTTIEAGKVFTDKPDDIEAVETILAKLQNSFIPLVRSEYGERFVDEAPPEIEARSPRRSNLVILSSEGPNEQEARHLEIHQSVVDKLVDDHHLTVARLRTEMEGQTARARVKLRYLENPSTLRAKQTEIESELRQVEARLAMVTDPEILAATIKEAENNIQRSELILETLKNQETFLKSKHQRLEDKKELLRGQIAELKLEVTEALARRKVASGGLEEQSQAMTLLMIDNEIQQNRNRLASLEEQLFIAIENRREELEATLEENWGDQEAQQEKIIEREAALTKLMAEIKLSENEERARIAEITAKLENLAANSARETDQQTQLIRELEEKLRYSQDTRALIPPMRSLAPVARSKTQILTVALILGLLAGIAAVFVAAFLTRVRHRLQTEQL